MNKTASLWDRPRPNLDTSIWDEENNLRPEHRAFIFDVMNEAFLAVGFESYDEWVKDFIIAGSIASYQYNETSDVDVDIIIDLNVVNTMEYGGRLANVQIKEVFDVLKKEVKARAVNLPGTTHPFEPFFIYEGLANKTSLPSNVGLYSILKSEWLLEPKEVDLSSSVEKMYPELMEFVWSLAEQYNLSIMGMRQDIVDASYLREALSQFPPKFKAVVESEIQGKLDEINTEIDTLLESTEELYEQRYSGPYPVMPAEVQVTYLRRYGYLWLMKEIEGLMSGRTDLEEPDLDDLGTMLKEVPRI